MHFVCLFVFGYTSLCMGTCGLQPFVAVSFSKGHTVTMLAIDDVSGAAAPSDLGAKGVSVKIPINRYMYTVYWDISH